MKYQIGQKYEVVLVTANATAIAAANKKEYDRRSAPELIYSYIHLITCVLPFSPPGFLSQCLENLLFDSKFWLSSLEEDVTIKVSIEKETLNLIYKGILMQEGTVGDNTLIKYYRAEAFMIKGLESGKYHFHCLNK